MDKLHLEAAQLDRIARTHMVELDLLGHLMLGELCLDDAAGQARGIDRCIALAQDIRDCADVVLMAMRNDIAAQLVQVALEIGGVRDHQVNAQHIIVREGHAAVDDHDVVSVFDHGHVLADLIETAQRYNLQFFFHDCFITFLYPLLFFQIYCKIRAQPAFFKDRPAIPFVRLHLLFLTLRCSPVPP